MQAEQDRDVQRTAAELSREQQGSQVALLNSKVIRTERHQSSTLDLFNDACAAHATTCAAHATQVPSPAVLWGSCTPQPGSCTCYLPCPCSLPHQHHSITVHLLQVKTLLTEITTLKMDRRKLQKDKANVDQALRSERAKLADLGSPVSNGCAGRPARVSGDTCASTPAELKSKLDSALTQEAMLRVKHDECYKALHAAKKRINRMERNLQQHQKQDRENDSQMVQLIKMRRARNAVSLKHMLWADATITANPNGQVGQPPPAVPVAVPPP